MLSANRVSCCTKAQCEGERDSLWLLLPFSLSLTHPEELPVDVAGT